MFDNKYFDWNAKRIKGIVDFYGYKFFYFKKILDLGCGYGDLGGVVYRLGADVTAIDARQEHLKIVNRKFNGVKTVQANLDVRWPFHGARFDLILDLGLLCHLSDYEAHLKMVCASTTHLVIETAVCDSDDPQKCISINEDKATYDLSYSGKGSYPSPAAIERVLRECRMNFKRVDNSKYNASGYVYDWYPKNDNSYNLNQRRIWFAVKESSPVQFANPSSEIATPPILIPPNPQGYISPIQNSGIPVTASPRVPMHQVAYSWPNNTSPPIVSTLPIMAPVIIHSKELTLNDIVKYDSREFALIEAERFNVPIHSHVNAVIAPNSVSARKWYAKVSPLFPNLKLYKSTLTMSGFNKTEAIPDIIMCSVNNLQAYHRLWIDEWLSPGLTEEHLNILKNCRTIITPSLINAQEIWKHIPHANVFRMARPWPLIETTPAEGDYYLYFEKCSQLTNLLFESWDGSFGNLVVVGSSIKTPPFATFISDTEQYTQIIKLVMGTKAIIDLSENNYYASGLNRLATAINLPIITNNHIRLDANLTLIQQDKNVSHYPTSEDIRKAIQKFMNLPCSKANFVENYNHSVADAIKNITGT